LRRIYRFVQAVEGLIEIVDREQRKPSGWVVETSAELRDLEMARDEILGFDECLPQETYPLIDEYVDNAVLTARESSSSRETFNAMQDIRNVFLKH
jgi:hypothetical protein